MVLMAEKGEKNSINELKSWANFFIITGIFMLFISFMSIISITNCNIYPYSIIIFAIIFGCYCLNEGLLRTKIVKTKECQKKK